MKRERSDTPAKTRRPPHRFTRETARAAGKKGGRSLSKNRDHMRAIGQKGAEARRRNLQQRRERDEVLLTQNSRKRS